MRVNGRRVTHLARFSKLKPPKLTPRTLLSLQGKIDATFQSQTARAIPNQGLSSSNGPWCRDLTSLLPA